MPITRCPECATAFRCHPEQLQQARGWVRCGRCSAVFEALRHVWQPAEEPTSKSVALGDGGGKAEPLAVGWDDLSTTLDAQGATAVMPPSEAVSRASRRALRSLWVALILLLPLQWLMTQRDMLAAQSPLWRGLWTDACRWLGCEVNWPRLPQALRMESIRMEPAEAGLFEVQLQIRNTAMHPLAAPWVELSLLGLRDDVLVRRAVSPQDLGLDTPVLALREVAAVLRFQLPDDVAPNVTGYKAILFYP